MDGASSAEQQVVEGFPEAQVRSIIFSILSVAEAEKISTKTIGAVNEVTDPALGVPNLSNQCTTCGGKCLKACEGHFGLINLPFTVINPFFLPEVAQILNKICPACKAVASGKLQVRWHCNTPYFCCLCQKAEARTLPGGTKDCKYCNGRLKEEYPVMKFKVSPKDTFGKTAITVEVLSRSRTSNGGRADDYWDFIPKDPQLEKMTLNHPTKRVLSHAQVYDILKDVDPRVFESVLRGRNDMFINSLLVTPNCYRLTEFGQHITFDASTRLYKKIADFKGTANELSTRVFDRIKVSKVRSDKSPDLDSVTTTSGLKYMKEILLTKRNDHSFRMVVVGDPSLKLGEIGVPCQIAEKLRVAEYVNDLNVNELVEKDVPLMLLGDGDLRVRRGGKLMRLSIEDKLQKGDVLYRPLSNGDILLINRPPSIHQHSILALSVKILPISYVLAINPHVCSPLRGDFDGDCLHGYIPQSVNSRIELSELVALSKQLINGQSGKNLLSLSHDSLTAAHLVLEDGVTLNKVQMQQLQMFCPHQMQLPAIMKTNLASSSFWTGKQLLSLCLPQGFDFNFPSNGVLIRKGEILTASNGSSWLRDTHGNLFYDLIRHCKEEFLDYLFAAQEVLREWLSMRGLSVSLSDLYLASDRCLRENLINEVSCGLQEAEMQSYISFLMLDHNQDFHFASSNGNDKAVNSSTKQIFIQQQTSAPISQASISAFKQVFMDIQHLAYQYAGKDNAFLIMLRAGSKGSLLKLVQHSLCLGLQNSVVPLSFGIPHHLTCAEWNDYKITHRKAHGIPEHSESYTPWAVVGSSFLTGLNPLECFVHSLTNRDSSFSGHADVSGTINRRIMYFMRDLYVAYDGTVRNSYGNHLVQFFYNNSKDIPTSHNGNLGPLGVTCASEGGHPVGLLAASAISEVAYSALELPCSALETSPLLNLKKVLECGVKKSSGDMTASLFLSKKLERWHYGLEYGALEVKSHLERLLFSDIISSTMISFSSETSRHYNVSPWVCHFHISKGILKRKRLWVRSIIQALHRQWYSAKKKLKNTLPQLQITSKVCPLSENETDAKLCITVSVSESSRNSSIQWEVLREIVMPLLLGTVIKGFSEFKKVDILWKDVNCSKPCKGTPNGLYLRVHMSESCEKIKFWGTLVDSCLQIREMIDWDRSHPDDVNLMTLVYGIDAARNLFLNRLNSAICDTGKTVLPEHLVLTADCLVATGEFVALNAKGLGQQRKEINVSSPLNQACFSSPGDCFIKAAKKGVVDNLQGTLDALAWGKTPSIGTGADFDIMYSWKGNEFTKPGPTDVYSLFGSHCQEAPKIKLPKKQNEISAKSLAQHLFEDLTSISHRKLMISKTLQLKLSLKDIQRLSQTLRNLLHKYDIDAHLNEEDKAVVVAALYFHPRKSEKIGTGIMDIKVGCHAKHENSRCFILERKDGTLEDFSYHKCVHRALQLIAPKRAENYESKWLQGSLTNGQVASMPPSWKSL